MGIELNCSNAMCGTLLVFQLPLWYRRWLDVIENYHRLPQMTILNAEATKGYMCCSVHRVK